MSRLSSTQHLPDPGKSARIGAVHWRLAPGEEELAAHLAELVLDPWVSLPGMELLRCDRKVFWGRLRWDGREYFVKGRKLVTRRRRVRSIWKTSAFRREWRRTWGLHERGVEIIEPVAVGELRHWGLQQVGFYCSRWTEGQTLAAYLEAQQRVLEPRAFGALRRTLVEELGALLGRLHHAGAYHRQFHDQNVFVSEGPNGRVLLPIDCQHVGIPRTFSDTDRAYNLRLLAYWLRGPVNRWGATRTEFIRFLRGYYHAAPESAESFAELVRRASRLLPGPPARRKPSRSYVIDRW